METRNMSETGLLYNTSDVPLGRSYEDWTVIWWRWLLGIPTDRNPAMDFEGIYGYEAQPRDAPISFLAPIIDREIIGVQETRIKYLASATQQTANRRLALPHGNSLLFPIFGAFINESDVKKDSSLAPQLQSEIGNVDILQLQFKDRSFNTNELKKFRVQSKQTVMLPENNIIGHIPGQETIISDGYWAFTTPLDPGSYLMQFSGVKSSYHSEVVYQLTMNGVPIGKLIH
jgi:hypothetical protein